MLYWPQHQGNWLARVLAPGTSVVVWTEGDVAVARMSMSPSCETQLPEYLSLLYDFFLY